MATYATTLRAVGSVYAKRQIRFGSLVVLALFIVSLILTSILAQSLSSYWWLLLIFILPMALIGLVLFFISYSLAGLLYRTTLTTTQKKLINTYIDKLNSVAEATQLSFVYIILTIAKDLLLYRELRTLRDIIGNSADLKKDLSHLAEKL